tara:strand:- start:837 stop:1025 length:189 start_codon:yes stop_codon:yes gene_type:complete
MDNDKDYDMTKISFVIGTVEEENEVLVSFRGFDSIEETVAYAEWLGDNLMLLLDESNSVAMH